MTERTVLFVDANADDRDVSASYENGANSYVRKPVDFHAFATTVERVATYWLASNVRGAL